MQYNADTSTSSSRADLVLNPPLQDLISFEGLGDGNLPFVLPPLEFRRSIKAALSKFKIQGRAGGNTPSPTEVHGGGGQASYKEISAVNARLDGDVKNHASTSYQGHFRNLNLSDAQKSSKKVFSNANSLRLKFNQGFSNAIRRPVHVSDFL